MAKKIKKIRNSQLHTPHDKLFKRSMAIPEVAKDFLNLHLPDDIKNKIDYSSLEFIPETFIDEWSQRINVPCIKDFPYSHRDRRCVLPIGKEVILNAEVSMLSIPAT
jgi:hypothetical protein